MDRPIGLSAIYTAPCQVGGVGKNSNNYLCLSGDSFVFFSCSRIDDSENIHTQGSLKTRGSSFKNLLFLYYELPLLQKSKRHRNRIYSKLYLELVTTREDFCMLN